MKHDQTSSNLHESFDEDVIITDVNPAYGEVKNTANTRTVYHTVQ